ncbi:MAG: hypothetical protein AAGA88_04425 [Pseudomonadota bacterium]
MPSGYGVARFGIWHRDGYSAIQMPSNVCEERLNDADADLTIRGSVDGV